MCFFMSGWACVCVCVFVCPLRFLNFQMNVEVSFQCLSRMFSQSNLFNDYFFFSFLCPPFKTLESNNFKIHSNRFNLMLLLVFRTGIELKCHFYDCFCFSFFLFFCVPSSTAPFFFGPCSFEVMFLNFHANV